MAKRLPATKVEINRQAFREALQIAQNLKTEPKTSQREAGA